MISSTFDDIAEIAIKQYSKDARIELEKQLNSLSKENPNDVVKKLGLPQILMFFSSSVAKSNSHEVVDAQDVQEAFSLLKYLISRDLVQDFIKYDSINLGLPYSEKVTGKLSELLRISSDMKTKNNLDNKITRLTTFLTDQKLSKKHINRIEIEMRAAILLVSRLIAIGRAHQYMRVNPDDIDRSYDIIRFIMFKLETTKVKILRELYSIDDEKIWRKIPKMIFDQSAHDHLSETAYARWEDELPDSFETLKKHLNCGSRPFISAIFGFSEIYGAKNDISKINSDDLNYLLEAFEKMTFGKLNPMIIEDKGVSIVFTEDGLRLLANISQWITAILVNRLGKDEFVLNYSSTVPRQVSLLLFLAFIEKIKSNESKINIKHILKSVMKWTQQLKNLPVLLSES
ncbi:MAG: hypothetical protein KGD59_10550 [Candidatus Heimdallarchaeota archaeon]|nr:hypothetical protein [Candidatus Heimdallarchaeota archaeon]